MGKVNSGDDGLECEVRGRLGEVVVVVRWPAEPMQQEVKGFIGPRTARGGMKEDIRLIGGKIHKVPFQTQLPHLVTGSEAEQSYAVHHQRRLSPGSGQKDDGLECGLQPPNAVEIILKITRIPNNTILSLTPTGAYVLKLNLASICLKVTEKNGYKFLLSI